MRRMATLCAALAIALSACGDDGGEQTTAAGGPDTTTMRHNDGLTGGEHTDHVGRPTSSCSPAGTTVAIVASGIKFDKDCLAAPASQPFTITYENKDDVAHNIAVLESHTATDVLFRLDIFRGPKTETLRVAALKPGTYAFHCEVHPAQMSGTFIVK
jgi:plastocyanin